MYFLETERIGFRLWRPDDVELAVALWTDPDVTRLIARSPPSRASAEARLAAELALQAEHRVQYVASRAIRLTKLGAPDNSE